MACANGNIEVIQLIREEMQKWTGEDATEKKQKFINQKNADKNTPLRIKADNMIFLFIEKIDSNLNLFVK